MMFLHPEFIYYILPILIFLFAYILKQKEVHEHYFSSDVIAKLRVNDNSLSLKQRNILFFFVGVLVVFALAQPVLKNGKSKVKSTSADILLALDISDSMLAGDVYPNRFELAKVKALKLIEKATNDRVGVIAFARNSYLVSPISFDTKTVSFLVSKLDTKSITQKGTDILTMLETVAKTHTNTDKKYLLLLSDGGDANNFSREIDYANEKGIVVFILGMGTQLGISIKKEDGSFIKKEDKIILSKLNAFLPSLAIETGGVYIENTTSLRDVDAMLEKILKKSEHKELKSQEVQRYVALFYYPIILAMIVLLMAFSSLVKRVKVNTSLPVFMFLALTFTYSPSLGSVFDFKKLDDAKKFYDAKDYNLSSQSYEEYAKRTNNAQAYYNAGNSYYREKKYLKALSAYSFSRLKRDDLRASKLSNMGNALTRLGTRNTLQRAIKHYEASLKIREDSFTRENLDAVKKALEEDKSKQQKKSEKNEEEKEYAQQKTDAKGDLDEANDTNNRSKNKKKTSKNKKSNEKINPNNKNKSDNDDSKEENGDGDGSENGKDSEDSQSQVNKGSETKSNFKAQNMSDLEQSKWFKKLSINQSTYLYRLNDKRSENEEKNENPW